MQPARGIIVWFPDQGRNPRPLRWKDGVLTNGPNREVPIVVFSVSLSYLIGLATKPNMNSDPGSVAGFALTTPSLFLHWQNRAVTTSPGIVGEKGRGG